MRAAGGGAESSREAAATAFAPALAAAHLPNAVAVKLFAPEGLAKKPSNEPQVLPCRVDDCGAAVPQKYP